MPANVRTIYPMGQLFSVGDAVPSLLLWLSEAWTNPEFSHTAWTASHRRWADGLLILL